MSETDELRARIVRLELEIANRQAYPPAPAPAKARGGSVFNTIGSIILIGLSIFGMWAALVIYSPELTGTPEVVLSLPTASIGRPARGQDMPPARISETVLPYPTPLIIPTDEPPASPPPIYIPANVVTKPNLEAALPSGNPGFDCRVEPGNTPDTDCSPDTDPGASVYSLEGRVFSAEEMPTSSPSENPGFDAGAEFGNQPTPVQ